MQNIQPSKVGRRGLLLSVPLIAAAAVAAAAAPMMAPMAVPAPSTRARDASFLVNGRTVYLHAYWGRPIMLWEVATWCPSCRAGLQTLARKQSLIDQSNLAVIVLRDWNNGGYPGPSMAEFVEKAAPKLLHDPHVIIGEDTEAVYKLYDPHHFVDVYYLIRPDGRLALTASAPAATFDKIATFIGARAAGR
ncbi:MAG: peroxiredoxin family protein [Acetobacteraceae bacterium]